MADPDPDEYADLVDKRADVLAVLADGPLEIRTVEERTDASRATVNRAIRALEDAGLVERVDGDYAPTATGRLALSHYRAYRSGWRDLLDARAVLDRVPPDAPLSLEAVVGGEVSVPPEEAPYRPVRRVLATLEGADRYRALVPTLEDPKVFRLLYEHVVTDGLPAELVVPGRLRSSLAETFPRRLAAMADAEAFDLFVGEVPPFEVLLTESDGDRQVTVVVFGEAGGVAGVVENGSDAAVEWAEDLFVRTREGAHRVGDPVDGTPDGGVAVAAGEEPWAAGAALPLALEREGFRRIDRSYLVERQVADPATAWRAGPDLAEVHTGYAVERTVEDGGTLADRLTDRLAAGEFCALVGPPGSGKSTTAKRVADEWYASERGPVFYRESGAGTPFDSVDRLVAAVSGSEDHPLVVVEDATRPEAQAVFRAVDRLADSDVRVSVLLDARESEWVDRGDGTTDRFRVEPMPPLSAADCERILDHVERTTGVPVDVDPDRLLSSVRSTAGAEASPAPGEALLLFHRLAAHVDPLAEGETGLEADAGAVHDAAAAAGDPALDVAVLAALLGAAGVGVGAAHLHALPAVGADAGGDPVDRAAVERAVQVLDGRALFGRREDGTYRTGHGAWMVAFLSALSDAEGESAARRRVCRVASALLSVADDPERLDRIAADLDDAGPLGRVAVDPGGWADDTVAALFALARQRPTVAGLLGDGEGPAVELPAACESVDRAEATLWLGRAFLEGGEFERAAECFEGVPEGVDDVRRRCGLAAAARGRGAFDDAVDHARACLDRARAADDRAGAAEALAELGKAATDRSEFDRARDRLEAALEIRRDLEDTRGVADCHNSLGVVAEMEGDYDRAREHHERSLELSRDLDDRHGEADSCNNLAALARKQGDEARGRELFRRAVELFRAVGDRGGEASALTNLGVAENARNEYDRAADYLERSAALSRELGKDEGEAIALLNLGVALRGRGEYDAARERFEAALAAHEESGDRHGVAMALGSLGRLAKVTGDFDDAVGYLRRGLEITRDLGLARETAMLTAELGDVALERGDPGTARERYADCLDTAEDAGETGLAADARLGLARVALEREDPAAAREYAEGALSGFESVEDPTGAGDARVALGRADRLSGDVAAARDRFEAAAESFAAANLPGRRLDALERLADLEREAGDPDAARETCRRALRVVDATDAVDADRREAFKDLLRTLEGEDAGVDAGDGGEGDRPEGAETTDSVAGDRAIEPDAADPTDADAAGEGATPAGSDPDPE